MTRVFDAADDITPDDNVQPIKTREPIDSPFLQQSLSSWNPLLTPLTVFTLLFIIGIVFIPTGSFLLSNANASYEKVLVYDGHGSDVDCGIYKANEGKTCEVSFTLPHKISGPLYLFYQLTDYYQNQRQYSQSSETLQLSAFQPDCPYLISQGDPKTKNGSLDLNPCGLIAASYFNDVFALNVGASKSGITLNEKYISWSSDRTYKYIQVNGFKSQKNPGGAVCDSLLEKTGAKSYRDADNIEWCFWYPNDDATEYLYEMYPEVSPLMGVTDEHFIVWMRTASTPTFRKLYGKISGDFNKGDIVSFNVTSNFEVRSYSSTKALILTTQGTFGNKNPNLGVTYLVVGSISFFFLLSFGIKHTVAPRPWGTHLIRDWEEDESRKARLIAVPPPAPVDTTSL